MSYRLEAGANYVYGTGPDLGGDYTVVAFFAPDSGATGYADSDIMQVIGTTTSTHRDRIVFQADGGGTNWRIRATSQDGSGSDAWASGWTLPQADGPYVVAISASGNNITFRVIALGGTADMTDTLVLTAAASRDSGTHIRFGSGGSSQGLVGYACGAKVWEGTALTSAQIDDEIESLYPTITTNFFQLWPMILGLNGTTGSNDLTVTGTATLSTYNPIDMLMATRRRNLGCFTRSPA
jgi:hypothetical protein